MENYGKVFPNRNSQNRNQVPFRISKEKEDVMKYIETMIYHPVGKVAVFFMMIYAVLVLLPKMLQFINFLGCGNPLPLGGGRSSRPPILVIRYIFVWLRMILLLCHRLYLLYRTPRESVYGLCLFPLR